MTTIRKQMLEISRLSEESDGIYHDIAQSYHLPDSVYWILYILYNYDEPVSQVDLCDQWAYSKQQFYHFDDQKRMDHTGIANWNKKPQAHYTH